MGSGCPAAGPIAQPSLAGVVHLQTARRNYRHADLVDGAATVGALVRRLRLPDPVAAGRDGRACERPVSGGAKVNPKGGGDTELRA